MKTDSKEKRVAKRFLTFILTLALIVSLTPSLGVLTGGTLGAQEAYADIEYKTLEYNGMVYECPAVCAGRNYGENSLAVMGYKGWNNMVGLRYDSTKINPHECPAKGVSVALQAKFGLPVINKTAVTLKVGQTYDLKLTYPRLSFSTWTRWRSDKSSIAKVNSAGRVTAFSPGTVLISGRTPNGRDIRCTVTVKP